MQKQSVGAKSASEFTDETSVDPGSAIAATRGPDTSGNLGVLLEVGTVLGGRYEILEMLGIGGMGAVYKAHDRELDRTIALKVVRADLARNPEILQRFKQELLTARQVTHKNVIRIFDLAEADGTKFITMEYLAGHDLRRLLADHGKLPAAEAIAIIQQVCAGVAAAHAEGVIHRDLKPGNIMRDAQGRVVVMDFGLARTVTGDGMTKTGAMLGTVEYMSPEQAKAEKLDARSDLFTIGLILYELLTGKTPYQADSVIASLLKRSQEPAVPAHQVDPDVPRALSDILSKALERDPAQRYQSVQEFIERLEEYQGKRRASAIRVLSLFTPRFPPRRWMLIGIAATLMVAIAVAAKLWVTRPRTTASTPHRAVSVLVADFTNHTGDPIFDETLEPMFNVALEGASFISAYNRGAARKLAQKLPHPANKLDEQSARLVAVNEGISAVITGELARRGDNYSLSATALDAVTGNVLAQSQVNAANQDQVLLAVPKLVAPLRQALGDTTPQSVQLAAAEGSFSTSNLEAVHQYGIGLEQQLAANFQGALQSFSKAAELDPNFARAYSGMAAVAVNLGRRQDAEKYAKVAMEHVDRLTERERYRIRGMYYITTENWQNCVEDYSEQVKQYPADYAGQLNLAICWGYLHNMPRALEAAQRGVELVPKDVTAWNNFSLVACYTGDFQSCERGAREIQTLNPAYDKGYLVLAYAQQGQGQLAQAAETYRDLEKLGARGASLTASGLANLALYEGRYRQAVQILERAVEADVAAKQRDQAVDHYAMLAYAELLRGEKQPAVAAAEKALAYSQSAKIQFLAARVFLEAGEAARARKLAAALASAFKPESQGYAKLILAEAAIKDHRLNQAVQVLTEAKTLADTWFVHLDLGVAYLEAGAFAQADSEFDRCMKRRGEALELFMDDMPTYAYLPPLYYYQGRALEGLKSPGAADSYRTYLSLREEAGEDPLLPEVRRRLSQLGAPPRA